MSEPLVTVVIPTRNGGELFRECVRMVTAQATPFDVEVLVIDSASNDGTPEEARRAGWRVHGIQAEDFNHGGTRQLGVELSRGEYVAFLSQDAVPADASWLESLVTPLREDVRTAGSYGRQLPRADCDPIARRRTEGWLTYDVKRRVADITASPGYREMSPWDRRLVANFDNVSSCVRGSVIRELPFGRVPFGEDVEWSRRVLEAGMSIVFEPASRVWHSHATTIAGSFRRAYLDHRMMAEVFGVDAYGELARSSPAAAVRSLLRTVAADLRVIDSSELARPAKWRWRIEALPVELAAHLGGLLGSRAGRGGSRK